MGSAAGDEVGLTSNECGQGWGDERVRKDRGAQAARGLAGRAFLRPGLDRVSGAIDDGDA